MYSWLCQPDTKCVTQPMATIHSNACPWEKPWNILMAQGPKAHGHTYVQSCTPSVYRYTLMFSTCPHVQPAPIHECKLTVDGDCEERPFFLFRKCVHLHAGRLLPQLLLCVPAACSWKDSVALAIVSTSVMWVLMLATEYVLTCMSWCRRLLNATLLISIGVLHLLILTVHFCFV